MSDTDPLEAIDKIVNGMISSRLFEVKADAEMWQVEIVQQISESAKQRMLSILQQEKNKVIVEIEQSNLLKLDYTKQYTRADIECRLSELSSAVQPPNTEQEQS